MYISVSFIIIINININIISYHLFIIISIIIIVVIITPHMVLGARRQRAGRVPERPPHVRHHAREDLYHYTIQYNMLILLYTILYYIMSCYLFHMMLIPIHEQRIRVDSSSGIIHGRSLLGI